VSARVPAWVNGEPCASLLAAATRAAALLGSRSVWSVYGKLKRDGAFSERGVSVSLRPPPPPPPPRRKEPEQAARALLRYPLGAEPWRRGVCRAER
jgi:hypothetical protein